jgi:hypothetical protein
MKTLRLALWDEERGRLVSFKDGLAAARTTKASKAA